MKKFFWFWLPDFRLISKYHIFVRWQWTC